MTSVGSVWEEKIDHDDPHAWIYLVLEVGKINKLLILFGSSKQGVVTHVPRSWLSASCEIDVSRVSQVWEEGYPEDDVQYTYLVLNECAGAWRVLILEGKHDTTGKVTYLSESWFAKPWARWFA